MQSPLLPVCCCGRLLLPFPLDSEPSFRSLKPPTALSFRAGTCTRVSQGPEGRFPAGRGAHCQLTAGFFLRGAPEAVLPSYPALSLPLAMRRAHGLSWPMRRGEVAARAGKLLEKLGAAGDRQARQSGAAGRTLSVLCFPQHRAGSPLSLAEGKYLQETLRLH